MNAVAKSNLFQDLLSWYSDVYIKNVFLFGTTHKLTSHEELEAFYRYTFKECDDANLKIITLNEALNNWVLATQNSEVKAVDPRVYFHVLQQLLVLAESHSDGTFFTPLSLIFSTNCYKKWPEKWRKLSLSLIFSVIRNIRDRSTLVYSISESSNPIKNGFSALIDQLYKEPMESYHAVILLYAGTRFCPTEIQVTRLENKLLSPSNLSLVEKAFIEQINSTEWIYLRGTIKEYQNSSLKHYESLIPDFDENFGYINQTTISIISRIKLNCILSPQRFNLPAPSLHVPA
jgi:hypothetical protein